MDNSSTSSSPRSLEYNMVTTPGLEYYDPMSGGSSPSSPSAQGFEHMYPAYAPMPYSIMPYGAPAPGYMMAQSGSVPFEFAPATHMVDVDRRRRRTGGMNDKDTSSHIHSRRRAQNRASQRAFRDRKEKHVKDLETRLRELEEKNQTLEQSYSDLAAEHSRLQREMERMSSYDGESSRDLNEFLNDDDFERLSNESMLSFDASDSTEKHLLDAN
ncbi:MAG: ATP-dependent DNA/RNA helicase [Chaenotheca gracillima]|nr:MAG: ATP-dependent DNA/RNA helicase [Chaenotheca gracillima]